MPNLTRILSEILSSSPIELRYALSVRMVDLYPGQYVLETEDFDFDPVRFAEAGRCALVVTEDAHAHLEATWNTALETVTLETVTASMEVAWLAERLTLLRIRYGIDDEGCWFIIARSSAVAERFFEAVCRFNTASEGAILVFSGDRFRWDAPLLASLKGAKWNDLALPEALKARLRDDTEGFFAAKEFYRPLGVPWKRGVLLIGPPGNGKTHALRTIVGTLGKPTFFVKSFKGERGSEQGVQRVFARARAAAPCVLVLEDLDSLVDAKCRSTFLNEMDGFESNEGILTLATTNHPEKLDPALLNRPSRFDRKIEFSLPAVAERRALFARFLGERLGPSALVRLARVADGLSGASIKEASLSGLMAWMNRPAGSLARCVANEVRTLRGAASVSEEGTEDEDDD